MRWGWEAQQSKTEMPLPGMGVRAENLASYLPLNSSSFVLAALKSPHKQHITSTE